MKKILLILTLFILILPIVVSAQVTNPPKYCKITNDLSNISSACCDPTNPTHVGCVSVCYAAANLSCPTGDPADCPTLCGGGSCPPGPVPCPAESGGLVDIQGHGACCVIQALYNVADWIFVALVAIAIIFALFGAFNLITAGGAPEKVTTGRNYILYAIVGLAVGFLALAIPSLAKFVIGAV